MKAKSLIENFEKYRNRSTNSLTVGEERMLANERFKKLSDVSYVTALSKLLLNGNAEEEVRKLFQQRTLEIGHSFHQARKSMEDLFLLVLRTEERIRKDELVPSGESDRIRMVAARFAARLISYHRIKELEESKKPEELKEIISKWSSGGASEYVYDQLAGYIFKYAGDATNGIVSLNDIAKSESENSEKWKYGLTVGPDENLDVKIDDIKQELVEFRSNVGFGLGGGRLDDGIESLIHAYVQAHAESGDRDERYKKDQHILIDALVRFAQKVLFIANNETLLNGNTRTKEYTMVLQSVGNSILVQANELKLRDEHQNRISDAYSISTNAYTSSFERLTAHGAFHEIIQKLGSSKADLDAEIAKIRDEKQKQYILMTNAIAGASLQFVTNHLVSTDSRFWSKSNTVAVFKTTLASEISNAVGIELQRGTSVGDDSIKKAEAVATVAGGDVLAGVWRPATNALGSVHYSSLTNAMTNAFLNAQVAYSKATNEVQVIISKRDEAKKIHDVVKGLESDVCVALSKIRGACTPEMARAELMARLREKIEKETDETKDAELGAALTKLKSMKFNSFNEFADVPMKTNSIGVLDSLIANLQYEYLQAVKVYGQGSDSAIQTARALKEAYIQRSGMAYIRPSSDYLKSSYPATGLQANPRLGWYNMLEQSMWKTFPGASLFASGGENARIGAEIDKQYWQTINSVRVSGSGRTQYVIAKDDVGNWYVKGYSTNPEDVINSAKNLANFSMGNAFGLNLPVGPSGDEEGAGGGDSPLVKIYMRHAAKYMSSTTNSLTKTIDQLDVQTLIQKVQQGVDSTNSNVVSTTLTPVRRDEIGSSVVELQDKRNELVRALRDDVVSTSDGGVDVLKAVKLLERLRSEGEEALTKATFSPNPSGSSNAASEQSKAIDEFKKEVNRRIGLILEDRRSVVDQLSSAVEFINDAANEE